MRRILAGLALLVAAWIGAGFAMVASAGDFRPAGVFHDIGGRRLRLVCEGPKGASPVVWTEGGAFGLAADFAAIQQKLAARGVRSCAYDRAGQGFSDPGPAPRDSNAIVGDLEKLMAASGEAGPYVLVGHSMAGLYVHHFAAKHPDQVAGVVLADAATPEMSRSRRSRGFLDSLGGTFRWVAIANSLGLAKPLYFNGDRIGLPPQGQKEKRRAYVSGAHARNSYAEFKVWEQSAAQAQAAGRLDPALPVAVIVAGGNRRLDDPSYAERLAGRQAPAKASRAGLYWAEPGASHTTLLGFSHGDAVVKGVMHVIAAAK